jgi:hypothetical protein
VKVPRSMPIITARDIIFFAITLSYSALTLSQDVPYQHHENNSYSQPDDDREAGH